MINRLLNKVLRGIDKIKNATYKRDRDYSFTKKSLKKVLKVQQGYYDEFEFLSHDCLIEEELTDLNGDLYELKSRLK